MKALLTADIHADNHLAFSKMGKLGVSDRMRDCLSVLTQLGTTALENECEQIWILGDLFNKRLLDGVTLKLVTQFLGAIAEEIEIHLIPGNHEAQDFICRNYNVEYIEAIPNVTVHRSPESLKIGAMDVTTCPYMPLKRHAETLEAWAPSNLLLTHQTVIGALNGKNVSKTGLTAALVGKWAQVLLGHYHDHQYVNTERMGFRIMYLGAPWQTSFGEQPEKFCWLMDFDDGKMKPLKMKYPEFQSTVVEWNGNWSLDTLQRMVGVEDCVEYLRLIIKDTDKHHAPIGEITEMEFKGRFMRVEYQPERMVRQWEPGHAPRSIDIGAYIDGWVERSDVSKKLKPTLIELGRELCLS
jgi:DNA repair exonuclease SbcCD nuclease subunit